MSFVTFYCISCSGYLCPASLRRVNTSRRVRRFGTILYPAKPISTSFLIFFKNLAYDICVLIKFPKFTSCSRSWLEVGLKTFDASGSLRTTQWIHNRFPFNNRTYYMHYMCNFKILSPPYSTLQQKNIKKSNKSWPVAVEVILSRKRNFTSSQTLFQSMKCACRSNKNPY